jgi:hypothetical protein
MTTRTVEMGKTTYENSSYYTIYRTDPLVRIDAGGKDRNVTSVIIAGKDFGARLKRKPDGNGFETKWLGTQSEVTNNLTQITQALGGSTAPRTLYGIPVVKIMSHPDFRIQKIELVQNKGDELWKVFFDRITKDPKVGSMYDSWIIFDPKSDWAVIEAQYHFVKDHSAVFTIKNKYVKGSDGLDRIQLSQYASYSEKSKSTGLYDFDIIEFDPAPPPASRFEMANLGLPDLKQSIEIPATNSTRNWLIVIALAFFIIAFGLNRAARRAA